MADRELEQFRIRHAAALARFSSRAQADRWNLDDEDAADAVHRSVLAWAPNPTIADARIADYIDSLHAEDLMLAVACRRLEQPAEGDRAWEAFVERFRPVLYAAARAIARDDAVGRELADSLYAELWGLEARDGQRRSLLEYFHGRSSLATWMRAVLAQRHVDAIRKTARVESLDETGSDLPDSATPADPPDPDRGRYLAMLSAALTAAIAALAPRERLRLSYYYLEGLTLREVGHLMNEYESSVSRRLDRTRRAIRKQVERSLRREGGLSDDQIRLCYDCACEQAAIDLTQVLSR